MSAREYLRYHKEHLLVKLITVYKAQVNYCCHVWEGVKCYLRALESVERLTERLIRDRIWVEQDKSALSTGVK